jgi:hypothetical protein
LGDPGTTVQLPSKTGRKRSWPMPEVVNAIFFVLRGTAPWRMLPE